MPRKKQSEGGKRARSAAEWKDTFLAFLRERPIVAAACKEAGIVRAAAYDERGHDPEFAKQWDAAKQEGIDHRVDMLEAALLSRAQSKSDILLIFALKSLKPDVYGDRTRVDLTHHVKIDDVAAAFRSFVNAVKKHVTDGPTIAAIEAEFTTAIKSGPLGQIGGAQ